MITIKFDEEIKKDIRNFVSDYNYDLEKAHNVLIRDGYKNKMTYEEVLIVTLKHAITKNIFNELFLYAVIASAIYAGLDEIKIPIFYNGAWH